MSRLLKLEFIVAEEDVGGILIEMEGRHKGVSLNIVELKDGRYGKDKPDGEPRDLILNIMRAHKIPWKKVDLAERSGIPIARIGYLLNALRKEKKIKHAPGRKWRLA